MKKIYIMAPANYTSGGPELAHQLCCALCGYGLEAVMYYVSRYRDDEEVVPEDAEAPERYRKYHTVHVRSNEEIDFENAVFVFFEGGTAFIPKIHAGVNILFWMSVDNYFSGISIELEQLKELVNLHLVQSHYARFFLENIAEMEKERVLSLSDYIGDRYLYGAADQFTDSTRENLALYNPFKGYEDLEPLIRRVSWLQWKPIIDMSEEEVCEWLHRAKIYVDFGGHPGKDRIPREAAASGCCVITNRKGSAAFYEDVPIPSSYKFRSPLEESEEIELLLRDICEHYDTHAADFLEYRSIIQGEKAVFYEEVRAFAEKLRKEF